MAKQTLILWFLIPLLWAVTYLPGLTSRDLRLEEGRRVTPAREMLHSGNYILPTLYGDPYLSKPPGYFWIVAGVGAIQESFGFPMDALSTRLPSVLATLIGALLIAHFPGLSKRTGLLAAILLLSSVIILDKGILGEIDATLSVMIFAAVFFWWKGEYQNRFTFLRWLFIGLLLAMATLTKGPPALVLFYVPVILYTIWAKRWRMFLSWGHLLALLLIFLPTFGWIFALHYTAGFSAHDLFNIWFHQLSGTGENAGKVAKHLQRYALFPLETLGILLPWIFWVPVLLASSFRKKCEAQGRKKEWIMLICFIFGSFLFFWLWPSARPRHMMVIAYPVALAAALVLESAADWPRGPGIRIHLIFSKAAILFVCLMISLSVLLSWFYYPPALLISLLVLFSGLFWFRPLWQWIPAGWQQNPTATAAMALALAILSGWYLADNVFWPYKAAGLGTQGTFFTPWRVAPDEPRTLMAQFAGRLPPESQSPRFTMIRSGGLAEGFFNVVFYFGENIKAIDSPSYLADNIPSALVFMSDKQYKNIDWNQSTHRPSLILSATLDRRPWPDGSRQLVVVQVEKR